jgi:hypothetical protein
MGKSLLTSASVSLVQGLLSDLLKILQEVHASRNYMKPSLVTYVFTPLSTILRRNASSAIPDQILERVFDALALICESWWWDCETAVWEQLFMLCGSTLGSIDGKGKGKDRDEETKAAATRCLRSLLGPQSSSASAREGPSVPGDASHYAERLEQLRAHAQTSHFMPILGQTLDWLLNTATSPNVHLSVESLEVLQTLLDMFFPDHVIPSVLPGVVSTTSKIALGLSGSKGWAAGDTVARALGVMQVTILRAVGDEVCLKEGAIRRMDDLEDLIHLKEGTIADEDGVKQKRYETARTPAWLKGTSSQVHMALNALTPLVSHPNPVALRALTAFSEAVLRNTSQTLPSSHGLLLSFLLAISAVSFDVVATEARLSVRRLLSPSSACARTLLPALMQITRDSLSSLPRLLSSHADAKVEHAAHLVAAACRLASAAKGRAGSDGAPVAAVSHAVGILLGPSGGIERWGWSLLSVLEFRPPAAIVTRTSAAQITLEREGGDLESVSFPQLELQHVALRQTQAALEEMFRTLGAAAGSQCLFAVEWFVSVDGGRRTHRSVSARWCAARLLEGVGGMALNADTPAIPVRDKHLDRAVRSLAKSVAEEWDRAEDDDDDGGPHSEHQHDDSHSERPLVEHVSGLLTVRAPHEMGQTAPSHPAGTHTPDVPPLILHRASGLQLIAVASGILQARSSSLLLHTIYPVLHSVVSGNSFLSQTGMAALQFVSVNASYASPSNLLLSNFDYALDAVSRHLTRRWLDVDATKALTLLVRLVGRDVVQKAGDVVETCFDRLDEFHGYQVVVEGLVEVLREVVKAVEAEEERPSRADDDEPTPFTPAHDRQRFEGFFQWFVHRHDPPEEDTTDYGPAPRKAWGVDDTQADDGEADAEPRQEDNDTAKPTPTQLLTTQIVTHSMFFLTHGSPGVRARILDLLASAVPVLPASALMPSIHKAWPFILNRLSDGEPFVISAAATLVEALSVHVGEAMFRRIWDDVWPRFRVMLDKLEAADRTNALARRGPGRSSVGTESAHTHSHRLYRSLLRTMTAAARGVQTQDAALWDVIVAFRRFLHAHAHAELQACARELYAALGARNEDAVCLALDATMHSMGTALEFLRAPQWDNAENAQMVLKRLEEAQ